MELGRFSHVVLGLLSLGPGSGYDLKALVDRSTRYFWAASYGQIYPELRRLAAAGLIEGESAPTGARARTIYRLTPAGGRALRAWLATPEAGVEVRDEGLLKLFFAGALGTSEGLREKVAAIRVQFEATLGQLRAIEAATVVEGSPATRLVLDYGLTLHGCVVRWCEEAEARLAAGEHSETTQEES